MTKPQATCGTLPLLQSDHPIMFERTFVFAGEYWQALRRGFPDARGLFHVHVFFVRQATGEAVLAHMNPFRLKHLSDDALVAALIAALERKAFVPASES
jgi:hypothetical protein